MHPTKLEKFKGTTDELVKDLSNLRYDSLYMILSMLSNKIFEDADKDFEGNRKELARKLYKLSKSFHIVSKEVDDIWKLCKKYMEE